MEHPNEQIEKILNNLATIEANSEKIIYLEEWIAYNKQDALYGPAIDEDALEYANLELRLLYKIEELGTKKSMNKRSDSRFKLPQQILLLQRTGIIKYLDKYNLTKEKKALLISKMIGGSSQNIRAFLGTINLPDHKDTCNTPNNNKLIDQLFSELGISTE